MVRPRAQPITISRGHLAQIAPSGHSPCPPRPWGAPQHSGPDERLASLHGGSLVLDLGIARDGGRLTTGLSVQNIGSGVALGTTRAQLPLREPLGMAGGGLAMGPLDLGTSLGVSVLPDGLVLPAAAIEAGYTPMEGVTVVGRLGLRRPELRQQQPLSFGGSATFDRFTLDYAYEDWNGGGAHRLALRVR